MDAQLVYSLLVAGGAYLAFQMLTRQSRKIGAIKTLIRHDALSEENIRELMQREPDLLRIAFKDMDLPSPEVVLRDAEMAREASAECVQEDEGAPIVEDAGTGVILDYAVRMASSTSDPRFIVNAILIEFDISVEIANHIATRAQALANMAGVLQHNLLDADPIEDFFLDKCREAVNGFCQGSSYYESPDKELARSLSLCLPWPDSMDVAGFRSLSACYEMDANKLPVSREFLKRRLEEIAPTPADLPKYTRVLCDPYDEQVIFEAMAPLRSVAVSLSDAEIYTNLIEVGLPSWLAKEFADKSKQKQSLRSLVRPELYGGEHFRSNEERIVLSVVMRGLSEAEMGGCRPLFVAAFAAAALGVLPEYTVAISRTVRLGFKRPTWEQNAFEAMADDNRPQVLYLRPFIADGEKEGFFSTSEEQLVRGLNSAALTIALAGPEETMRYEGAARFSCGPIDWKSLIALKMLAVETVLIRYSPTEGVSWEAETALKIVYPTGLAFMFCDVETSDRKFSAQDCFDDFKDRFEERFNLLLPQEIDGGGTLVFDQDWSTRFIPLEGRKKYTRAGVMLAERAIACRFEGVQANKAICEKIKRKFAP